MELLHSITSDPVPKRGAEDACALAQVRCDDEHTASLFRPSDRGNSAPCDPTLFVLGRHLLLVPVNTHRR